MDFFEENDIEDISGIKCPWNFECSDCNIINFKDKIIFCPKLREQKKKETKQDKIIIIKKMKKNGYFMFKT